jgi:nuclear transport factor 2 (NTF2) superfamily protein
VASLDSRNQRRRHHRRPQFLRRKWARELDYKLRKYLWAFRDNRIAVCFEYEYRDAKCVVGRVVVG